MKSLDYQEYKKIQKEVLELSTIKNKDYGCEPLLQFGDRGILVRISDKFFRLKNLIWYSNVSENTDETIEDTLKDLINYATYMIMLRRNKLCQQ